MNLFKFYRLDFCLRNLGLGLIGIFSLDKIPSIWLAALSLFQILLIQMSSFSMNNYFDYKAWKEDNYIGFLLNQGFGESLIIVLTLLPLAVLAFTIPFSNAFFVILVLYTVLFFIYQSPLGRLKNHYFSSIVINSLCLGSILYIYPYLFLSGKISMIAGVFSIIFFLYLGFHEVIHQIAHFGKDRLYSLPKVIGIRKTIMVAELFLLAAILTAIFALYVDPRKYFCFSGTIVFSLLRLYKLRKLPQIKTSFEALRNRKDKFYSFQEGVYYLLFLIWR
ncbi:MAG: UbiA family prenyltransferase [Candidatus Omnitrophota bacterium]